MIKSYNVYTCLIDHYFNRYYLRFDWSKHVVTIKQLEPLSKFDKWWLTKLMCIEGTTYVLYVYTSQSIMYVHKVSLVG